MIAIRNDETAAGYKVWVDKKRLLGGEDSCDEIDSVLRGQAVKQIVVFTKHVTKPGVKKELAIGDTVRARLADPKFMIAIRNDETAAGYKVWVDKKRLLGGDDSWDEINSVLRGQAM